MKITITLVATLFCFNLYAQPNSTPAVKGTNYGVKIVNKGAIEVDVLEQKLETTNTFKGKFKGTVVSVCEKKGCWMKLAQTDGEGIMIRFDYKFFMPLNIVGKDVVIDGVAKVTTTSVEDLKHYAEDEGKSKEEIAKITEPKKEIEITAKGVLVTN